LKDLLLSKLILKKRPVRQRFEVLVVVVQTVYNAFVIISDTTILTACQLRRQQAVGQSSSGHVIGAFIPRCTGDGYFEPLQCHSSTGVCWCVDRVEGLEMIGSRQRVPSMPDCTRFAGKTHLRLT